MAGNSWYNRAHQSKCDCIRQKQRILYTMVQISDRQTNILRVLRSMYNQSGTTVRESMRRLRRSHHKSSGKVRLPANAPTFFFCVRFFVFLLSFLNHMDGVTPPPSPFLPFFHKAYRDNHADFHIHPA